MSSPNRFDKFEGEEVIFMYIAMDTYVASAYNAFLDLDGGKLTKEHEEVIENKKHLISELVKFGQEQGSIPKKGKKDE